MSVNIENFQKSMRYAQDTFHRRNDESPLVTTIYSLLLDSLDYTEIQHYEKVLENSHNPKLAQAIQRKKTVLLREQYNGENFSHRRLFKKRYVKIQDFDIPYVLQELQHITDMTDLDTIPYWEELSLPQKSEVEKEYWKSISKLIHQVAKYTVSSQKIKHDLLQQINMRSG